MTSRNKMESRVVVPCEQNFAALEEGRSSSDGAPGSSFVSTFSATVSASNAHGMELSFSNIPPHDARILYSVAPSMGHNKENHPESNLRVPAIVNALEAFELTSKYRGLEVFEMQNFPPASVDDIARVHARAYVAGLEKVTAAF
ncbi:Histone deacetylase 14 [Dendrobium catenatum]|uniref:Histone deacetylase 14 n=1 Tax=Dendrobium catenatum TaxID=906689 RepID=A0A2I0VA01_9ASPA|nr:Histone deacetylase 14 [Dendrobium catenatum]